MKAGQSGLRDVQQLVVALNLCLLEPREIHMEIFVLSFVAGLVVVGGLWLASRATKPIRHDDLELLAESAKLSADRTSAAVDEALEFVRKSNLRIDAMEKKIRRDSGLHV